ncbi:MAG: hypothetical protein P8Y24_01895 [Gammaproteobacteria bacterium]|jgi:hypothetical protein
MFKKVRLVMLIALLSGHAQWALAAIDGQTRLKPFTLAYEGSNTSLSAMTKKVEGRLKASGFQVIGQYNPYSTANILIITSKELKKIAAKSSYGGFGAALRVAITDKDKKIQVTHNNPNYVGLAYNMKNDLANVKTRLKKALGYVNDFGGGEGVKASDLPDYNYTFGLEGFTGFFELATFKSHRAALQAVESNLEKGKFGISKVYRLDVPGKQQSVFGLSLKADAESQPFLNDEYVMNIIDYHDTRSTPHLPYELMVNGNKVIAMHPHFRLAINFPDLKMFGKNSFGKLMDLPYVYEEFFIKAVGGKWPPEDNW